jgi:hypothetical protein
MIEFAVFLPQIDWRHSLRLQWQKKGSAAAILAIKTVQSKDKDAMVDDRHIFTGSL